MTTKTIFKPLYTPRSVYADYILTARSKNTYYSLVVAVDGDTFWTTHSDTEKINEVFGVGAVVIELLDLEGTEIKTLSKIFKSDIARTYEEYSYDGCVEYIYGKMLDYYEEVTPLVEAFEERINTERMRIDLDRLHEALDTLKKRRLIKTKTIDAEIAEVEEMIKVINEHQTCEPLTTK